jgi:predicted transcriptional regulator
MKNFPDLKTPYRELSLEEIMNCMFGLKSFETKIYIEIIDQSPVTVNDLVKKFDKDRSTVQRALQNLAMARLIYREQKNIKNGGYYYVYNAAPFDEVKATIKSSVRKWAEAVAAWVDGIKPKQS